MMSLAQRTGGDQEIGQPSHLRPMMRLVLQGLRSRPNSAGRYPAPKRRVAVELPQVTTTPRRANRFLAVTDGERIPQLRGEGAVLPPTLCALWETALVLELLSRMEEPLDLLAGFLHLGSEVVQVRPVRLGEPVRCRMELERAEPHPRGMRLTLLSRNWNAAGQLCLENQMLLLVRGGSPRAEVRPERTRRAEREPGHEDPFAAPWRELVRWRLRPNHGRRYARVSGDYNPIHLWAWTARWFGFRRPILHGFCTEAMIAHALIERLWGGNVAALRRLQISFGLPVLLPAELHLLIRERPGGGTFRLVDGAGKPGRPYAEGEYVGAAD